MIKILMVGNSKNVKGGITTVINQYKKNDWKNKNIEFKFIPTYDGGNNLHKIIYFIISYIKIFFEYIINKPDIIHIHMSYKGSFYRSNLIVNLSKIFKAKTIIHLHGSEFEKWFNSLKNLKKRKVRNLLAKVDQFIVLGNEWFEKIKKIEPKTKITILSNSVEEPCQFCSYNNPLYFLFLGVLIKRKGVNDILEAIKLLKNENKTKKIKLIIAGSGDQEKNLKEKCQSLNLNDIVSFTGWIDSDQKIDLIKNCQCMILPSYNEGLPMSILEAMSYGLPIISTDVGDITSVVINNYNGYIIKPGDINKLKESIEKMINCNKKDWIKLSENSKKIINENYSSKKYFEKIKEIYINIANK